MWRPYKNEARVTKLSAIYREMHPHLVRRAAFQDGPYEPLAPSH